MWKYDFLEVGPDLQNLNSGTKTGTFEPPPIHKPSSIQRSTPRSTNKDSMGDSMRPSKILKTRYTSIPEGNSTLEGKRQGIAKLLISPVTNRSYIYTNNSKLLQNYDILAQSGQTHISSSSLRKKKKCG